MKPSDAVISRNLADQTRRVLSTLTPREEKVLRMRFGIGEKSDHTLEEVGQDFEVTRERIRQIEAKAWRKLRHPSRAKRLKSFCRNLLYHFVTVSDIHFHPFEKECDDNLFQVMERAENNGVTQAVATGTYEKIHVKNARH